MDKTYDHIVVGSGFGGSVAALRLTPVTLELGGKSPCIIHHDAPMKVSARRIIRGKPQRRANLYCPRLPACPRKSP